MRRPPAAAARPAPPAERLRVLDALRGAAILGILLVNVQFMQGPEPWLQVAGEQPWAGADLAAWAAITALVRGKLFTVFAFLFGLGLALQTRRVEARGLPSGPLLARRLAVLAGFGAIHALGVWSGDVLLPYALLGLLLLPFRHRRPRTLLRWAAALTLIVTAAVVGLAVLAAPVAGQTPSPTSPLHVLAAQALQAYGSGSYPDMVVQRFREITFVLLAVPLNGPVLFAAMLAGLATGRSGLTDDLDRARPLLRLGALAGLGLGLPLNLAATALLLGTPGSPAGQALLFAGQPILAAGYAAGGALVLQRLRGAPPVQRLEAVGRMALTNYLAHSVLGTAAFIGLGWYGRASLLAALGFVTLLWALSLMVSPWWLARAERGPVEALWRRLTYGR